MSTKSLMADKRVAEVTLNDAGKAATLTLAPPWLFEGSPGPFNLTNVEHGHKIVKGAIGCDKAARAPRSAKPAPATGEPAGAKIEGGPNPEDIATPRLSPQRRSDDTKGYVYRIIMKSTTHNHEVASWHMMAGPNTPEKMRQHARSFYPFPAMKGEDRGASYDDIQVILWTEEHEKAARDGNYAGCPWKAHVR